MLCKEPLYVPIFGNIVGNTVPSLAKVLEHHNVLRDIRQSLVLNVDFNTCEWNELYYKYIRRLRQNKESRLQLIHRATQSLGLLGSSWQFKRFIKWRQFLTRGRELKVMSQQQRWLSTTRVDKEQHQLNSRELARGWVIDRFKTISINLAHATSLKLLLIFQ